MKQITKTKVDLFVVIADDDIEDHKLITRAVKDCNLNHIVTSVYNGRQLLDLLEKNGFYRTDINRQPDLIILDLKMPIMDGFEVLREIRNNTEFETIPIFVLSESTDPDTKMKSLSLGARKFFTKPFSYEELKSLMRGVCEETQVGR